MSRSPHQVTQILKVYTEVLTRFTHIYHSNDLNNTWFSQGYILENGSHCGKGEENEHSKDKRESEEPPISQLVSQHVLSMTSSNNWGILGTTIQHSLQSYVLRKERKLG